MLNTQATQYIKATLAAFGPGEAISMTQDTWAKLHEAMSVLIDKPEQMEQEPWICERGAESYLACKCAIKSPQRKPLTPEWIWMWLRNWCDRHPSLRQETYNSLYKMVSDARAIEADHGIKEKNT